MSYISFKIKWYFMSNEAKYDISQFVHYLCLKNICGLSDPICLCINWTVHFTNFSFILFENPSCFRCMRRKQKMVKENSENWGNQIFYRMEYHNFWIEWFEVCNAYVHWGNLVSRLQNLYRIWIRDLIINEFPTGQLLILILCPF